MLEEIDVYKIEDPPIVLHPSTDMEHLAELAESIKRQGLINPITVRKKGDHYQLIDGYNRVTAAKKFGIPKLPARILEMDDKEALIAATTANILRTPQDPLAEGELYKKLREEHGMSAHDIAEKFGRSETYVSHRIKMLELPDIIKDYIKIHKLTPTQSLELLRIPDDREKILVAHDLARSPITVQETKTLVDSYLEQKKKLAESPPEEVLEEAKKIPQAKCNYCKELKPIDEFTRKIMCNDCEAKFFYLLRKEQREAKVVSR